MLGSPASLPRLGLLLCTLAVCLFIVVFTTTTSTTTALSSTAAVHLTPVEQLSTGAAVAEPSADEPQLYAARFQVLSSDDPLYSTLPAIYRPSDKLPSCRLIIPINLITQPVLNEPPGHTPGGKLPINTVLSLEYLNHPELDQFYDALGASFRKRELHRKAWEWAMGVRALHELGAIKPDAVGLSLAAGHEPVHYYLSNHIKMMYAGDMYGVGGFAADGTASQDILSHPEHFAPKQVSWRKDRLTLLWQNARNLSYFEDSTLDFVVSFGSIEHFGGNDHAFQAANESITEQARVVKPGGVVFMTTELVLTGAKHNPVLGNGWSISQLKEAILVNAKAAGLELVQPINWGISKNSLLTPLFLGTYGEPGLRCNDATPHNIVCLANREVDHAAGPFACWTSISLAFRKPVGNSKLRDAAPRDHADQ